MHAYRQAHTHMPTVNDRFSYTLTLMKKEFLIVASLRKILKKSDGIKFVKQLIYVIHLYIHTYVHIRRVNGMRSTRNKLNDLKSF